MDGASLASQGRGPGFLLEACREFCQAESIPVLQLQPDSSLGFGHQWLSLAPSHPSHPPTPPGSSPAEKGQLYPAAYVRLGWKPLPGVKGSAFLFSLSLPIPVGSRMRSGAAGLEIGILFRISALGWLYSRLIPGQAGHHECVMLEI